ncbi:hypothetical protein AKO1_014692 [Acrasis kona]|uniref:Clp1 P-loop domain-containing protein n=1 Tax=Acrasis kona TaxID=1008807 RepID=A0AAW2Z1U0_9EUKA
MSDYAVVLFESLNPSEGTKEPPSKKRKKAQQDVTHSQQKLQIIINKYLNDKHYQNFTNNYIVDGLLDVTKQIHNDTTTASSTIKFNSEMTKLTSMITQKEKKRQIIMVTGLPYSGKSTFCRYLINSLLNSHPSVCYLDLDPSAPEFSISGQLSLIEITSPLIGPSCSSVIFNKDITMNSEFFGFSDPEHNVDLYMKCVLKLINIYKLKKIPLVVHCYNHSKGAGYYSLLELIRVFTPHHLIKIKDRSNFDKLDSNFGNIDYESICGIRFEHSTLDHALRFLQICPQDKMPRDPKHLEKKMKIYAMEHDEISKYYDKKQSKYFYNALFFSYFVENPLPNSSEFLQNVLLDSSCRYKVPWNRFRILLDDGIPLQECMYRLNGTVVALGVDDEEYEIEESNLPCFVEKMPTNLKMLGFAIVSCIYMSDSCFELITPIQRDLLGTINTLLCTKVEVPNLFSKSGVGGNTPYISSAAIEMQRFGMGGAVEGQVSVLRDKQKALNK